MSDAKPGNRERIIETANRLFYTKGYNLTSFADVADELGISKGNLHYHFPSKDGLLEAIVALRMQSIQQNLMQWDKEFPDAKDKLRRFVQMMLNETNDLSRYGCPLGSLNMELGKCQRQLQDKTRVMFDLFQHWLQKAFQQLGRKDNKALSIHLLSMAQGAVLLAYVYEDSHILEDECKNILNWLETL
jgi:AcrR family transcriptional regulator